MTFSRMRAQKSRYASLEPLPGGYRFSSAYDSGLLKQIKEDIPEWARKWDTETRAWLIEAAYGQRAKEMSFIHFNLDIDLPDPLPLAPAIVRMYRVEYISLAKDRGWNEDLANGATERMTWPLILPRSVLERWFGGIEVEEKANEKPAPTISFKLQNHFQRLNIPLDADSATVSKAFKRLARQWHPDVCKEKGAREMFELVNESYRMLQDDPKAPTQTPPRPADWRRRKYAASVRAQATQAASQQAHEAYAQAITRAETDTPYGYRSPLRCGWLLVEGTERVKGLWVDKIMAWEDIPSDDGSKVMTTSWPEGADGYEIRWVQK